MFVEAQLNEDSEAVLDVSTFVRLKTWNLYEECTLASFLRNRLGSLKEFLDIYSIVYTYVWKGGKHVLSFRYKAE